MSEDENTWVLVRDRLEQERLKAVAYAQGRDGGTDEHMRGWLNRANVSIPYRVLEAILAPPSLSLGGGKGEEGSARSQPCDAGPQQPRADFDAEPSGAGRTIHVVTGQTGEYSDRREWLTLAFDAELEARAHVELLTTKRQELGFAPGDWGGRETVKQAMTPFDPGYQEDYTGTSWFVQSVQLHSSEAQPNSPAEAVLALFHRKTKRKLPGNYGSRSLGSSRRRSAATAHAVAVRTTATPRCARHRSPPT